MWEKKVYITSSQGLEHFTLNVLGHREWKVQILVDNIGVACKTGCPFGEAM